MKSMLQSREENSNSRPSAHTNSYTIAVTGCGKIGSFINWQKLQITAVAAAGPADIKNLRCHNYNKQKGKRKRGGKVLAPFVETVTTVYKQKHTEREKESVWGNNSSSKIRNLWISYIWFVLEECKIFRKSNGR